MALGTPVAAAAAYSASAGTTVAPAYPAGILATDAVLLFVGQKPGTANGGTVTTPAGWTLRDELTAAGGYGTTLGADTGNTNLRVYSWNTPVAGQTGTLSVTLAGNGVTWAFMVRIPSGGGTLSYGSADGQRTTTPTSPMSIALTNGATATNFESGDRAIWAMCIPTDVTTPAQFSAQSITATGATFGTATELNEPDSTTGNDIGGYSAWAAVTAGSSTTAPTVTATLAGTLTNVRGPVVLLRVREAALPPAQTLTPSLYTNTSTFHNPTVTRGAVTLTPALVTNGQTFFSADVTQAGGTQDLTPALVTNTSTFFAPTAASNYPLSATRYDNAQTFFSPAVTSVKALTPALYTNTQTFYAATVTASKTLQPARLDNAQTFFAPTVAATYTLAPPLLANSQTFYALAVTTSTTLAPARFDNAQTFYSAVLTQGGGPQTLLPDLYSNAQTFFAATASATYSLTPTLYTNEQSFFSLTISAANTLAPDLLTNTQEFFAPTVGRGTVALLPGLVTNAQTFYAATATASYTIAPALAANDQTFYSPTIGQTGAAQTLAPDLYTNAQTFYSATVTPGAVTLLPQGYVDDGYVSPGYVGPNTFSTQAFYAPAVAAGAVTLLPPRLDNSQVFYQVVVSDGTAVNESHFGGFIVNVGRMMGR